jgi:HAMP domain-containing protein
VLPTTHIYAALIILVLGVMLGKFFLWDTNQQVQNHTHPLENLRHGPPIFSRLFS